MVNDWQFWINIGLTVAAVTSLAVNVLLLLIAQKHNDILRSIVGQLDEDKPDSLK